jgi:hypothetical protein
VGPMDAAGASLAAGESGAAGSWDGKRRNHRQFVDKLASVACGPVGLGTTHGSARSASARRG